MPMMDILNNPNDSLKFSYSYARNSATQADKLVIEASTDCGGSWQYFMQFSASTMQSGSGGVTGVPFVPTLAQWKQVNITEHPNWFNYTGSQSVLFRFVFTEDPAAGAGNRLFIDAVNFEGIANGINELTKSYKLNLYPNPTNSEANIKFNFLYMGNHPTPAS